MDYNRRLTEREMANLRLIIRFTREERYANGDIKGIGPSVRDLIVRKRYLAKLRKEQEKEKLRQDGR